MSPIVGRYSLQARLKSILPAREAPISATVIHSGLARASDFHRPEFPSKAVTNPRLGITVAVIAIAFVVIGLFFRAYALDRKVYGFDETATLLRVAGTTLPQFVRSLDDGSLNSTVDVRNQYQRLQPGANAAATIHSLAVDDPQHPPLYYVLERWWQTFGDSIAFDRALAVIFGIALLPAAWWLARELFDDMAAAIMVALVAVSPFQVIFAQYNREYSLWALLAALSSAAFLAAIRAGGALRWAAYALYATLGMYTDPLFFFVLCAQGLYALAFRKSIAPRRKRAFLLSVLVALVAFTPWLLVLARQPHLVSTSTAWNAVPLSAKILLEKWLFEFSAVFFDAEYNRLALVPVALLVTLLVLGAIAGAAAFEPRRRSLVFAILLTMAPTLPFVISDLLFHTSRSTASRYLTPGWLGLELLVAAGLAAALQRPNVRMAVVAFGSFILIGLSGVVSLRQSAATKFWWIDSNDAALVPISAALDSMKMPRICYVDDAISILILSDSLKRQVDLSKRPGSGCLAVATATHMKSAPGGASAYEAVPLALTASDKQFADIHTTTAQAHNTTFEPLTLWRWKLSV